MSFEQIFYTAYEEQDGEMSDSLTESSGDEVEQDVVKFLNSKRAHKTSLNKSDLADDFENEMEEELNEIVKKEKNKYSKQLLTDKMVTNQAEKPNMESVEMKKVTKEFPKKIDLNKEINYEIEDTDSEEELATGVRSTKMKPQFTNDELLYDPDMDDDDQNWMNKQRKTSQKIVSPKQPVTSFSQDSKIPEVIYKAPNSDAILNCPCCMALICMDCQRHENFKTQYRAMFVFNSKINHEEKLKYPKNEENKKKNKKFQKNKKKTVAMMPEVTSTNTIDKEIESVVEYDLYCPVSCTDCNTNIGVYDETEEIYYFFNVLASHS